MLGQANDIYDLEIKLGEIPLESFLYHSRNNDFSRWLYSLAEVELAANVRALRDEDFDSPELHRQHLIKMIKTQRMVRQKGVIVNFDKDRFDPDTEFLKIGNGSLGGKARGLAFFSAMLHRNSDLLKQFANVEISVPQTFVLTTESFDSFIEHNSLEELVKEDLPDEVISDHFSRSEFPEAIVSELTVFLKNIDYPLAVRSSSLLEDAQFKSYAGLYHTCIVANDHPDNECRLSQLLYAIKTVYASTYYRAPKSFTQRVGNKTENEKMAVIIL